MSNASKAPKAEPAPAVVEKTEKKEATFPLEVLRKDSLKLFGVTTSTFDGAMDGHKGPFTVAKAREIIDTWKRGVVK